VARTAGMRVMSKPCLVRGLTPGGGVVLVGPDADADRLQVYGLDLGLNLPPAR